MNDDGLVARIAVGDDAALRDLFGRHASWLAVRLRALLPAADVEDTLQETFLAAWRARHRPGPGTVLQHGGQRPRNGVNAASLTPGRRPADADPGRRRAARGHRARHRHLHLR